MKRIFLIGFLFVLSHSLLAQTETFYVIHLKGIILNQTTGKNLKVGDKLNATDKIKYNPETASAVVMSSQRGRFVIGKPQGEKSTAIGDFVALVKNTMIPAKSNGQLSTRGGENEVVTDLKNVFSSQVFVFPATYSRLILSPSVYPMNNSTVMVYSFSNNGKTVNKTIGFSKDTLIFDKKALYVAEGQPVTVESINEASIYYYNKKDKSTRKIASFKPVFVTDEATLQNECEVLVKMLKNQKLSEKEILDQLAEHVAIVYGGENAKTDKQMLSLWLKEKMIKL
jgi:hypothetical protein